MSEFGESLYINLPLVSEEWIEARQVEFWCGGVSEFRQVKPCHWGDAFEKHYTGLQEEKPVRFSAVSDMCEALVCGKVVYIVAGIYKDAELWEIRVVSEEQIETFNRSVYESFSAISRAIADEWARHFGIEI